jgi:hypothetical protein
VDLEELAVVVDRPAAGLERFEQDLERLVVALDHLGVGDPRAPRNPAVPAADAELVAAAHQDVAVDDPLRQHHRVVVREHVDECAEIDPLRPLRGRREQCDRVGRDGELREEEVLDRRVRVETDPVGVLDLLENLGVDLRGLLPRPPLELAVEAELHRRDPKSPRRRRGRKRASQGRRR